MLMPRGKAVRAGVGRMKIRVCLEDEIDLPGNPPPRFIGMRKHGCRPGLLLVVRGVLRGRGGKDQDREEQSCDKTQQKRWTYDQQWMNVVEALLPGRKDSVNAPRLHKRLQDQHRSHAVNRLYSLLCAHFVLAQHAVGFSRGKPLVP